MAHEGLTGGNGRPSDANGRPGATNGMSGDVFSRPGAANGRAGDAELASRQPDWAKSTAPLEIRPGPRHRAGSVTEYPMPAGGGADSWQSPRRAPRPVGHPGDVQPGQPEPITTGRGARIGLRAAVVGLTIVAVLVAVGYGIYDYMRVPPLTDLSAEVVSDSQIDLGFVQSGILSRILVHSGEHVKSGQLLAEETVAGLAQEVAADRQAVSNDEAIVGQLNQLLNQVTYEASQVSSDAGKTAQTTAPLQVDLANANSQLLRDRDQLTVATAIAAEATIRAPAAGTVTSISGQPGEVVTGAGVAGSGATGGAVAVTPHFQLFPSSQSVAGSGSTAPVVVLATGGPTLINVVVPETQIGLVHLGDTVIVTPTVPGLHPVSGTVTQIFSSSVVAAGQVSYEVQVTVASHSDVHALLLGMTATATFRH